MIPLSNQWIKKMTLEVREYFEVNENENRNLQNEAEKLTG